MRTTILQRISDGFLPVAVTSQLYKRIYKIHETDINGWSFVHLISGYITAYFISSYKEAFYTHTLWEMFQFIAGDNKFDLESAIDITLDTLFYMFGFYLRTGSKPNGYRFK